MEYADGPSLWWSCANPEFLRRLCVRCRVEHPAQVECGDRSCPGCNRQRQKKFVARWAPAWATWKRGVFLTLTIPNVFGGMKNEVRKLRDKWRKLRRTKHLAGLTGGWYTVEVTRGKSLGWNLHLHVLAKSTRAIDYRGLRRAWRAVGGGTWIHVSSVRDVRQARYYVSKEISKGSRADAVRELSGVRLIQKFGTLESPSDNDAAVCPTCEAKLVVPRMADLQFWYDIWCAD